MNEQRILPQPWHSQAHKKCLKGLAVCLFAGALAGCTTVSVSQPQPEQPASLEQANVFLQRVDSLKARVDYELNQQERACYERFFVYDCVSEVREVRNAYRRSILTAESKAAEIIRLDRYTRRQMEKQDKNPTIVPLQGGAF